MSSLLVINHYLLWHYTAALKSILHIWTNFIWFIAHFFSIALLLRSLFSPWKRMTEPAGKGFDLEAIGTAIVIGFFSRLVGAVMRSILIIMGSICLIITTIALPFVYLLWLTAPILIIILLASGIFLIF